MVRPPEEQAEQARLGLRLSLIYSARPQADVKLRPVESPLLKRLGVQREGESRGVDGVTAEGESSILEGMLSKKQHYADAINNRMGEKPDR